MKGKKVLIFDDNQDLLELCTIILEEIGCIVVTSSTSDNADIQVMEHLPDIILMDNWLPNLSGIEATKLIKSDQHLKNIPVIYFSANNNVQQLAEEAGADDYLAKPFNIADLEKIVKKHLDSMDNSVETT
jgi:two-component system cell cycle response regulator DivK